MSLIHISHLTFSYDGSYDTIFDDVSFQMDTDWKLGFTGRNGCGKTTFLKLLLGEYEYRGSISASVPFDYFPFSVTDQSLTALEIAGGISQAETWRLERELSLLRVENEALSRPFETLSNGERTKVLLAILFLKRDRFLLIDEPTNHLDRQARDIVGKYLRSKRGFILVSHDRAFLDSCIDHILSINKTNIEIQSGNFSAWMRNKERRDNYELGQNERLKKEIKRLQETARQKAGWADKVEKSKKGKRIAGLRPDRGAIGHKAAKMMKRAKSTEDRAQKAAEEKSKLLKNLERADELKLFALAHHADRLAEFANVSVAYADKSVCQNVCFTIDQGERVALSGRNGCGKSSLLKLLAGRPVPHTGTVYTAANTVISYVPQDASFLSGSLAAFARQTRDETLFRTLLRKMGFSRAQLDRELEGLSEGQRKKVLLARSLCERAHLYIWDEPLNYIDVISRMQIERMIKKSGATMIFVEHDRSFEEEIATKRVKL